MILISITVKFSTLLTYHTSDQALLSLLFTPKAGCSHIHSSCLASICSSLEIRQIKQVVSCQVLLSKPITAKNHNCALRLIHFSLESLSHTVSTHCSLSGRATPCTILLHVDKPTPADLIRLLNIHSSRTVISFCKHAFNPPC